MQGLVLGVLVDLCDNPKVHAYICTHTCTLARLTDCGIIPMYLYISLFLNCLLKIYFFVHQSLSHVTAWQGKGPTNCWSLLARLWKEEEKSLEVIRDMGALAGKHIEQ